MKKILIATLLISGSAFALAVNAQEVFKTNIVEEAVYQEPISVPAEALAPTGTLDATTETPAPAEEVQPQEDGGPQNIVNIPTEQEPVAVATEETQEVTLSADDEIRKDGEEKALKIFNAIDEDSNGAITQEEFLSFHSKLIERKILKSNSYDAPEASTETQSEVPEASNTEAPDVQETPATAVEE